MLGFDAIALVDVGRFAEALSIQAELEPLAERLGNHGALMQARRVRAMVDFCTAPDLAALEAFARADLEFVAGAGLPWIVHDLAWIGLARFLAGDWDAARAPFEEGVARDPVCHFTNGWHQAQLFEYLAYVGDREAALALLDNDGGQPPPEARTGPTHGDGGSCCCRPWKACTYWASTIGLPPSMTSWSSASSGPARSAPATYDMRLPERAAGIAAAAGRCWDDAEEHFRTALRQAAELPHLPEAAHTRRFFATMLLERDGPGDRAEAAALIDEARELYRTIGMPKHEAMLDGLGR